MLRERTRIISFVCIMAIYIAIMFTPAMHSSWQVFASNAAVVILALIGILKCPDRAYSAKKFVYYFIFFFMGLAPLMQYKTGTQAVGGYIIHQNTYTLINCVMVGVIIVFNLAYSYIYDHIRRPLMQPCIKSADVDESRRKLWRYTLLGISVGSTLIIIWFYHENLMRIVVRSLSGDALPFHQPRTLHTYIDMAIQWIARPLVVMCCLNYWVMGKNRIYKAIFLGLMVIACFPTSVNRLRVGVYYLALIIIMFPALRFKNRFSLLFFGGLLLVFPFLNNFRQWSAGNISLPKFDLSLLCTIDYDSYQSFAFAVQNKFIDTAQQLSEFFLFWIPRIFWADKPMPSSYRICHAYDLNFDYIAMNFWGEGYILCGFAGVFFFTLILAWAVAKMDWSYWHVFSGSTHNLFAPFYLLFIGLVFIILRGELIGAVIDTCTILGVNYLIYRLSLHFLKSNRA